MGEPETPLSVLQSWIDPRIPQSLVDRLLSDLSPEIRRLAADWGWGDTEVRETLTDLLSRELTGEPYPLEGNMPKVGVTEESYAAWDEKFTTALETELAKEGA